MLRSLLAGIFLFLTVLALLPVTQSCATPTSPTGGDRDTLGPVLVPEKTTPNFQTNFRPEEIVLTFDEWVELDPQQEIFISPPVNFGPEQRPFLQRKSLVIPLAGVELLDSVTYVVNVGGAVKDLNEGNPTKNLRFAFATGPVLDSAQVSGTVVDEYTRDPVENATFTLYQNLGDTAVFTENPTYFAQTDGEGAFTIYNVRPGTYRGYALVRNPAATNYFYDTSGYALPTAAGFLDSIITIPDGVVNVPPVGVSEILRPVRIAELDTSAFGRVKITFNQTVQTFDYRVSGDYLAVPEKDTLNLFYRNVRPADTLIVGRNRVDSDTLTWSAGDGGERQPVRLLSGPRGRLNPFEGAVFRFNRPLDAVDTSKIQLLLDTFPNPVRFTAVIDSVDTRLRLTHGWQVGKGYSLRILPGALTDWTGGSNADTISMAFAPEDREKYGTLRLTLTNLGPATHYILTLFKGENQLLSTRRYVQDRFEYTAVYEGLEPGEYRAEIIADVNENRRYDATEIRYFSQAETVRRFVIDELRANWEVEQVIDVEGE